MVSFSETGVERRDKGRTLAKDEEGHLLLFTCFCFFDLLLVDYLAKGILASDGRDHPDNEQGRIERDN